MNSRAILWISLALNLALAVGIVLLLQNRPTARATTTVLPAIAQPAAAVVETAPATNPPPASEGFHWSRLVSEDLKVYRARLRVVGCPAPTIRDIIMAEINERFEQRRRELLAEFQSRFWDLALRGEAAIRNEWGPRIEALSAERQIAIEDVLGKVVNVSESSRQTSREEMQRHLSWLPQEKREQLWALEASRQRRLEESAAGLDPQGQAIGELDARLQREFDEAKEKLLTPEELAEFRLRASRESLWAVGMSGFEPTEDEWRAVTRARMAFDDAQRKLASPELSPDERTKREDELRAELTQTLKAALGSERFAQYEIANDGEFQEVFKVTQRYGLPDRVAVQAYEVRQAAMDQAQHVRDDPTLSEPTRQATLAALQQETQRALAKTLGEKVLATYKEYGGDWLKELGH